MPPESCRKNIPSLSLHLARRVWRERRACCLTRTSHRSRGTFISLGTHFTGKEAKKEGKFAGSWARRSSLTMRPRLWRKSRHLFVRSFFLTPRGIGDTRHLTRTYAECVRGAKSSRSLRKQSKPRRVLTHSAGFLVA